MGWDCLRKCCSPIPQRFIIATMVLSGLAVQYIHRLAFNLTLTEITYKLNVSEAHLDEVCDYNVTEGQLQKELKAEFHWDANDQANLLGAFYWGYIVSHLPGGVLADLYGPKRVLGFGVLLSALCSFLTPVSARMGVSVLYGLRMLMGIAQGPVFPCLSTFISQWAIPNERNLMSSYMSAGVVTGAILGNFITGFLLFNLNQWEHLFYIYGFMTLLWYILWHLFTYDSVEKHPFISEKEGNKITEAIRSEIVHDVKLKLPILPIALSMPVWAMIIASISHDWAFYIIVSMLPQYMSYVLRFNVKDNGLINCFPYIAMVAVSLSSAKLAECIVTRGYMTKTIQCKVYLVICNMLPCACYIGASYAGCNRPIAVTLFVIAMGVMGMIYNCLRIVNVDMSPNFAGTLMSLMNGFGSLSGVFCPKLFALFTKDQTVSGWRTGFFVSTAIIGLGTIVFMIFGTSNLQSWNFPPGYKENEETPENEEEKAD